MFMKKIFLGERHNTCPPHWDKRIGGNPFLHSAVLNAARHSDTPFSYVTHREYICCEYKSKLNLFTFGRLRLEIPMTVVGLPASLDMPGYSGNLRELIADYRKRAGLFLLLNLLSRESLPTGVARGETLGACIFQNPFASFEEYLDCLRSGYRRRVKTALEKGAGLQLKRISPREFSGETHRLYLNVLNRSQYPLETLKKEFFQEIGGEIYAFYHGDVQIAFFCLSQHGEGLHFLFGGMDYAQRDPFDLYCNMLLAIIRIGIEKGCPTIDFGQTAEDLKCKLGCSIEKRYMAAFSRYSGINLLLRILSPLLQYRCQGYSYRVFKDSAILRNPDGRSPHGF